MKAIIEVDAPGYQIGQEVNIYFKDTMMIKGIVQEQKTGHWIKSNIPNEEYVCSECGGASWYYDYKANVAKSKYCPNCGARMTEGSDTE